MNSRGCGVTSFVQIISYHTIPELYTFSSVLLVHVSESYYKITSRDDNSPCTCIYSSDGGEGARRGPKRLFSTHMCDTSTCLYCSGDWRRTAVPDGSRGDWSPSPSVHTHDNAQHGAEGAATPY